MKRIAKHLLTALKTTGLRMKTVTELAQEIANQELEATLAEVFFLGGQALADRVRTARRPKSPTQAEKALEQYDRCVSILEEKGYFPAGCIRDALVRLKELEDSNG